MPRSAPSRAEVALLAALVAQGVHAAPARGGDLHRVGLAESGRSGRHVAVRRARRRPDGAGDTAPAHRRRAPPVAGRPDVVVVGRYMSPLPRGSARVRTQVEERRQEQAGAWGKVASHDVADGPRRLDTSHPVLPAWPLTLASVRPPPLAPHARPGAPRRLRRTPPRGPPACAPGRPSLAAASWRRLHAVVGLIEWLRPARREGRLITCAMILANVPVQLALCRK